MAGRDRTAPAPGPPEFAPSGPGELRVAFGIAYDGAGFHGFALQPGATTVAGVFLEALERITGGRHRYTCAGRTDAGVHAIGQVVHVDLPSPLVARRFHRDDLGPGAALPELARALTRQLAPRIVVWRALVMGPRFDARRSARSRRYRYDLGVGTFPDPLQSSTTWWVGPGLDLSAMRIACDPLLGSHDFAGFCRRPPGMQGPLVRLVTDASWRALAPDRWRFEIESNAFCHQMVRSVVGWHVAIGQGRARPSRLVERLRSGQRVGAPTLAPPCGLCLESVTYPDEFGGVWREGAV